MRAWQDCSSMPLDSSQEHWHTMVKLKMKKLKSTVRCSRRKRSVVQQVLICVNRPTEVMKQCSSFADTLCQSIWQVWTQWRGHRARVWLENEFLSSCWSWVEVQVKHLPPPRVSPLQTLGAVAVRKRDLVLLVHFHWKGQANTQVDWKRLTQVSTSHCSVVY